MGRGRRRSDVEEFITELPDEYLECRRFGHQRGATSVDHKRRQRVFKQGLACGRCGVEWTEQISDRTGEVIRKSAYHYPDDYLAPRGSGRLGKVGNGLVRLELARRTSRSPRIAAVS